MKRNYDLAKLEKIAQKILDEDSPVGTWIAALKELEELIDRHTPFRVNDQNIAQGQTLLSSGLAILPTQAAMCMREISRTAKFMQGLRIAIQEKIMNGERKPIRVLYAGCGPYALLVFPLMTIFSPGQVQFTLLEIHSDALNSAKVLLESLGLESHVSDFVCGDAAAHRIDENKKPDIIISETMNACLGKEPLVTIMKNLVSQAPGAILIPQSVSVEAFLVNVSKEHVMVSSDHVGEIPKPERDRVYLGKVFELDKQTIAGWMRMTGNRLPGLSVEIPKNYENRYELKLLTDINVYEKVWLKDYDSSLTYPRKIPTKEEIKDGTLLKFEYELGSHPGLVGTVL